MTVDTLPEVRWYGNHLRVAPGVDLTSDVAVNLALYNYGISAAAMDGVEIGDPYIQIVNGRDLFGEPTFVSDISVIDDDYVCWFAQGASFPEGRQAQIADMYEARARLLFGT